jgi:hypothetical protein
LALASDIIALEWFSPDLALEMMRRDGLRIEEVVNRLRTMGVSGIPWRWPE